MKVILQIFIAIIPLIVSFSTSDPTLHIRFLWFGALVGLIVFVNLLQRKSFYYDVIKAPIFILLYLLIGAFLVSTVVNGFGSESIYGLLKLFLVVLFALYVTHVVIENGFMFILKSFIICSLLLSIIYAIQFIVNYSDILSIDSEWKRNKEFDSLSSTMGHKNLLSSFQFLMLPILIYTIIIGKKTWKYLAAISVFLILLTFIQTQSRGVLAAVIIFGLSFLFLHQNRIKIKHLKIIIASFIMMTLVAYVSLNYTNRLNPFKLELQKTLDFSSTSRYDLYASTLKLIAANPIVGVGPGNWRIAVSEYDLYEESVGKSFAQRPHNDFLWVFAEGGIIAGISYLLIFLLLLRDSYFLHKKNRGRDGVIYSLLFSSILGYGFISLVDFPMERLSHNIIFFLLASIITSSRIKFNGLSPSRVPIWSHLCLIPFVFFALYVAVIRYNGALHATNAINFNKNGKHELVINAIDKAYNPIFYEIDNTSTPLLWYKGLAYFNIGDIEKAHFCLKKAYLVNPYHLHVLNNLATTSEIIGDRENAKLYYTKALGISPHFKESSVNLAAIYHSENNFIMALNVIIKSKVDDFWKRKRNKDNYDFYLKTIYVSWLNSLDLSEISSEENASLQMLLSDFNFNPKLADNKLRNSFNKAIFLSSKNLITSINNKNNISDE
jgi:O-antigen ligase